MKLKRIPLTDLKRSFELEVSRRLSDYSVAIGRIRNDDPKSFRILGSGVFAVRNGVHGILTAHHCLHACTPQVQFDREEHTLYVFALRNSRQIVANSIDLRERPLAFPGTDNAGEFLYREYGPDLTFIEILKGPRLSSLKALVSFWNLDRDPGSIRRKFCIPRAFITNVGFPEVKSKIEEGPNSVHITIEHHAFWGSLHKSDIRARAGWDYIQTVCDVRLEPTLPRTFAGLSGGGIWVVQIRSKKGESLEIADFVLVGINFYERRYSHGKGRRFIRGHFVKSIYNRAWKGMGSS